MKHSKHYLALGAAAMLPSYYAAAQADKGNDERPNILFILSDDHTSQSWGIYGGHLAEYAQNQNIRRLASEGVVLDNCFCTNSISVPSRASILTGRYSHRNGVYTLEDSLDTQLPTIATQLQSAGYSTALVGKWHLRTQPKGFDYYSVFYDQGEYRDPTFIDSNRPWPGNINYGLRVHGFSTDIVTNKVINWLKANADSQKPFMMCCHFKATHEPYDFPERMRHLYDGVTFPEPENLLDWGPETNGRTFPGQPLEDMIRRWRIASDDPDKWWCRYPELPFYTTGMSRVAARKAAYQKLIRDYLRCGATIDDNIGRLLETLDQLGIADNTIVVYVADQGYFLGEHGWFDKRMYYEEAARMPFVIRYPKEIPAGKRNADLILNVDFAATLADYAGASAPEGSQGRSFRQNLRGNTPTDWRSSIYYRYWTQHEIRPAHIGVRTDRYKLLFIYGDALNMSGSSDYVSQPSWEFFDLQADPKENHNAINDKQYQGIIKHMKAEMMRLRQETGDTDADSPRMQEILRSQGLIK
ncbi:MAG: sulfatase [Muribaculaceae bacterium]